MLNQLQSNAWRPVDAWWQRAVRILDGAEPVATPRRDSGRGSGWIKKAQRFRYAIQQATTDHERMEVMAAHPTIYWAAWIHEQAATSNRAIPWAIEARILARQSDAEIGQTNGCWPQYIEAYEALFFNVRDRMDNRDFVLQSVLTPAFSRGFEAAEAGSLWKLFGYLGGPHVLDAMMSGFPGVSQVKRPEGISSFFQDLAINSMKQKAAVASMSMPVGSGTYRHLLEAFVKCVEIERTTDSAGTAQDQIQNGLQNLLESFPFLTIDAENAKRMPFYTKERGRDYFPKSGRQGGERAVVPFGEQFVTEDATGLVEVGRDFAAGFEGSVEDRGGHAQAGLGASA